jgi:hypothetical protein
MMPGHKLPAGIEARLDVMGRHGAELPVGKVLLARVDHLHRLANRFRETNGIEHDVLLAASPTETAADKMLMIVDVLAVRPQQACYLQKHISR